MNAPVDALSSLRPASPVEPRQTAELSLEDGRRLAWAEFGEESGAPVFYFQGTSHSRWARPDDCITRSLGARLIVIDRPGFGCSDYQRGRLLLDWPNDVIAVASELDIDRFAVVGIAPYVAVCAHQIPGRLTAASIVGGMAPPEIMKKSEGRIEDRPDGFRLRWAPWSLVPRMEKAFRLADIANRPGLLLDRDLPKMSESDRRLLDEPDLREMFEKSYSEAYRRGARGLVREMHLYARPWGFRLEKIRFDTVLWHGEEDYVVPIRAAIEMAARIPGCRIRSLKSLGHFALFAQWQRILTDLLLRHDLALGRYDRIVWPVDDVKRSAYAGPQQTLEPVALVA